MANSNWYADVTAVKWDKGNEEKRKNDKDLYSIIDRHLLANNKNKRISMLSFPARHWVFESKLSKIVSKSGTLISVTGLEKNDEVFTKSSSYLQRVVKKEFPKNSYVLINKNASSFMKKTEATYDLVYLDWMGTWSKDKCAQINMLFRRGLLRNPSVLIFTLFSWRGNGPEMDSLERMKDKGRVSYPIERNIYLDMTDNIERKTYGVAEKVIYIGDKSGYDVKLRHLKMYPGTGDSPQLSFAFTVRM